MQKNEAGLYSELSYVHLMRIDNAKIMQPGVQNLNIKIKYLSGVRVAHESSSFLTVDLSTILV